MASTQKVKDLIGKLLEAIGLKSTDFNVDTERVANLKDFADNLSKAIAKGKTVNVKGSRKGGKKGTAFQNIGPKKKLREFEKQSGKKVNQTAKRIAFDKKTEF